jgi:hypothetical protein
MDTSFDLTQKRHVYFIQCSKFFKKNMEIFGIISRKNLIWLACTALQKQITMAKLVMVTDATLHHIKKNTNLFEQIILNKNFLCAIYLLHFNEK